MSIDIFQLVWGILAVIGGMLVIFFALVIVDSSFGFGIVHALWPTLTPDEQSEIEKRDDVDPDIEKLVDRIMALPPGERALLAEIVEREAGAAGIELPPFPK